MTRGIFPNGNSSLWEKGYQPKKKFEKGHKSLTLGKTWKIKDTTKMKGHCGVYKRIKGVNCGLPTQGFQKGHKSGYCLGKHWKIKDTSNMIGREVHKKEGVYMGVKRGTYDINGKKMFLRSSWEYNYALYLDWLIGKKEILKWEYEAEVFIFHKIQFGTRSYRPDFKVYNLDGTIEYHEVKGWMNAKSKTKLKRMAKYYPEIKVVLIDKREYKQIMKYERMF